MLLMKLIKAADLIYQLKFNIAELCGLYSVVLDSKANRFLVVTRHLLPGELIGQTHLIFIRKITFCCEQD